MPTTAVPAEHGADTASPQSDLDSVVRGIPWRWHGAGKHVSELLAHLKRATVTDQICGFGVEELSDKIVRSDGLTSMLCEWVNATPPQWSPPTWWEWMIRLALFVGLFDCSVRGIVSLRALRERVDQTAARIIRCWTEHGVIEGSANEYCEARDILLREDPHFPSLPFSEGDLRTYARAVALALVEKMRVRPEFAGEVEASVREQLPNGKWPVEAIEEVPSLEEENAMAMHFKQLNLRWQRQ